jgi:CheY-like chemotaxis protein
MRKDRVAMGTIRELEGAWRLVLEASATEHGSPERLVALLDHTLSEMDGCDLLEIVAQDAALRERHAFIFVTASPRRAEKECGETLDEMAAPLVAKPFDLDTLLAEVAQAVARLP